MLLEIKNVKKYFPVRLDQFGRSRGDTVKAVDDVSLTIGQGESVSLVGESGCGKTTLARLILRLMPVTDGQILFGNENITQLSPRKLTNFRKNCQMVFQDPYNSLDPRMTIRSIIQEGMHLDPRAYKTKNDRESAAVRSMESVGLKSEMLNRYPHEFSGGERQRIAIARALAVNPSLLLLDEAVSSLDVIVQGQILELLKELKQKFDLTYLFISHNLKVVKKISDRIAVMYQGKIVEVGPKDAVLQDPLHLYTQELLSAALEYRVVSHQRREAFSLQGQLVERSAGHFVLEK